MRAAKKALLGLALLLSVVPASAASVEERSAFYQGHWWNPARAGSGFDFFEAGGEAMLIWYTYDAAGRPIWYTAQGRAASLGKDSWPLLKHRWQDGRKAGYEVVGSVTPTRNHAESIALDWQLEGQHGRWDLSPFVVSGVVNEIDHTGSWFDPANSGWGLALTQQGDVLGGVLFTYDANGAPTWAAGFTRERDSAVLNTFTGACPWCAWAPSTLAASGRLRFDFHAEAAMTVRNELPMTMAAGVNVEGSRLVQLGRPASTRPADRQLAHFDSPAALKAYLAAGLFNVRFPGGGSDFSASPPAASPSPSAVSQTNLQEAGVDEADLVKSNGAMVYTIASATTRSITVRTAAMGPDGSSLALRGSVPLVEEPTDPRAWQSIGYRGLYLHGERLVALTEVSTYIPSPTGSYSRNAIRIDVMDTRADGTPVKRWHAEIDGTFVATRRIGERLYLVSRNSTYLPAVRLALGPAAPENLYALSATTLEDFLPKVRIGDAAPVPLVAPTAVYTPPPGARPPRSELVVVTAIDMSVPRVAEALAIVGTTSAVYVSPTNLYLTTSRYEGVVALGTTPASEPVGYVTDVHQIRLGSDAMAVVGSGSVEGFLPWSPEKAAFQMSEHAGALRVVSSSYSWWGGDSRNRLTVLEPSATAPGVLRTVSYLPNAQRPQRLGKPGELLYGTRFAGDRLYAVTFRVVDPLYVVDLANPADPRIAGELLMPGYSEYLHPLPNGLLLGFGKDARPALDFGDGQAAWYQGLQLGLYDVSDASRPRELQRVLIGKRGSDSVLLRDHHAFSALPRGAGVLSLAFPARVHDGTVPAWGSGDSATYPWLESGLMRFELLGSTPSDARLVQAPSLITHRGPSYLPFADPASVDGRSVLFPGGTVYVGSGQFWHRDAAGTVSGPY